ncbi:AP-3 complex subunit mu isoform X4 [Phoenix dactylifera]|uniref:AP-3 complex subunit mu isoform X4 n=1 Tax=Phoenix dactylifera TaxID=42345 RepID=A0A8B9AAU2_PHODC|nr:AP-3 complex subunit mu isoform X4 [Phoenix dactylifera]
MPVLRSVLSLPPSPSLSLSLPPSVSEIASPLEEDRGRARCCSASFYCQILGSLDVWINADAKTNREVILEKQMTGHRVDRSICAWFWDYVLSQGGDSSKFLCRVADVLTDYLGGLNEDLIKDNFIIVYELLDEMMDNGFPLTTEPSILREMIAPPNIVSKMLSVVTGKSSNVSNTLPDATSSFIPWRKSDMKNASNEVYVNLVEEMDAVVNREGVLVKCEIYGEIQVNSNLPGLPDLTLSFANPTILNDVRFHPCVRFRPWESDQILSFVPPDGQFKLMSYRVKKLKSTPIYVKPQLTSDAGNCRINVLVGIRNDPGKTIDSITVQFQLPLCVASADLASNHGTVDILADKTCNWSIGRIPKDKSPSLSGNLVLEGGLDRLHVFPVLKVGFKIMGVALSGLQIDKLDIKNTPARPYKGFRALTQAGEYEVRS